MAGKKRVRRTRAAKKGGHPFLVLLFFIALIMGSAYMTDRMTNAPDSEVAQNVTTIGHLFNDKEMQGLVPKEDQGTPESVKEKIKAAMDKVVTVQVKADDEEPAGSSVSSNEKKEKDGSQTMEKGKKASFSLPSIVSKITGKEESHENTAAPSSLQGKPTEAASSAASSTSSSTSSSTVSTASSHRSQAAAAPSVKKDAGHTKDPAKQNAVPVKAAPAASPKPNTPSAVKGKLAVVIDEKGLGGVAFAAGADGDPVARHKAPGVPACVLFPGHSADSGCHAEPGAHQGCCPVLACPWPSCDSSPAHGIGFRYRYGIQGHPDFHER